MTQDKIKDSVYDIIESRSSDRIYAAMDLISATKDVEQASDGHYYIVCPICKERHELGTEGYYQESNYNKRKLGIMPNRQVGHCFRCGSVFLNSSDEIVVSIPHLTLFNGITAEDLKPIKLSHMSDHLNKVKELDILERDYLLDRNPRMDIEKLGIKSFNFWDDRPNVFIPFNFLGEIFYYQLRFIDNEDPKYFMPSIQKKLPYIPEVRDTKKIVIVEGVFDAIACLTLYPDRTPIAILGSDITKYHINILRKYFSFDDILIHMDETHISEKIAKRIINTPIAFYINDINVVQSDGMDPEELLRDQLGIHNDPLRNYQLAAGLIDEI